MDEFLDRQFQITIHSLPNLASGFPCVFPTRLGGGGVKRTPLPASVVG